MQSSGSRILRASRVPIGLLTNRRVLRLVYAPHGESSGSLTFRFDDLASQLRDLDEIVEVIRLQ